MRAPGQAAPLRSKQREGQHAPHLARRWGSVRLVAKRGAAKHGSDLHPPPQTWLNRYRREAGIFLIPFASAAGISVRTLQRLESGQYGRDNNPPLRYLVSCAAALELDDWHLLLEDEWQEPLPGTYRARLGYQDRPR